MAMMSRLAALVAAAVFTSSLALAIEAGGAQGTRLCEREMLRASEKYGVPVGVLYAVGLTETGRGDSLRPYALNIEGDASYDMDKDTALRRFVSARARGAKLIDVGCLQINHHFHAEHFRSVEQMLEPAANVDYAARFLKELKDAGGQLDDGGGALSRRAKQRSSAEALRVPRDRQHGCRRFWRVDQAIAGVL
jgi:soluble lytic murein transglycosylase-like protein